MRKCHKHKPLSHAEISHKAWQKIHEPFILPRWAKHEHEWQTYDMDMAGCIKCGEQHVCTVNKCATVQFEDGSSVCAITGLCLPGLWVSNTEYSDCMTTYNTVADHAMAQQSISERDEALLSLITQTLNELILSSTAEQFLRTERNKLIKRRTIAFNKRSRQCKALLNPNMIDILAYTIHNTCNYRTPQIIASDTRERIVHICAANIVRVFKLLNLHSEPRGWKRSLQRTKSLVVGLIYMTRMGMSWNDTIILPCMPTMRDILPQESCLSSMFGMRAKIITETENFVKMSLRTTTVANILRFAGDQYTMV